MIDYVIRAKKLTCETSNNYKKMHGKPIIRWVQIIKLRDKRIQKLDRERYKRYERT